ncbi:VOC family protein [Chitinibacter bivalviorum]|uniref:VOC family protein n=1 Tax=Chitinibacter bivalviorum TaxID=2739434 RepID=A0A7H9BFI9_9NEIS|nr:VOC family protein [Chitinibacter bivalviorum]QLG86958.1 VOC family protein [Chitinibacter bivalviorum]
MAILALDHINFRVPAELLDSMKDFYVNVVGLTVGDRPAFGTVGYWLYAGGHPVVHLSIYKTASGIDPCARNAIDHLAFRCDDAAAAQLQLQNLNVGFSIRHFPAEGLSQIFFADPVGNTVELNCPYQVAA